MGFRISNSKQGESFFYPVKVPVIQDNGRKKTFTFEMKLRRMTKSEYFETVKSDDADTTDPVTRDAHMIMDLAEDWRYVEGDDGQPLVFNFDNLFAMINTVPSSAIAIISAFNAAVLSGGQTEKN